MNINQLPENHHVISSMVNPFDANEELFFVVNPKEETGYWDLNIWFCDMGTGEVRATEPYDQVSDTRLRTYMEEHVSDNPEHFAKPPANKSIEKRDLSIDIDKLPADKPSLPENHYSLSSMLNPFNDNEKLWFITHPGVNTYLDVDVWFCNVNTGEVRVVEPYSKVSDVRLLEHMERHVERNSVNFLYPAVILPIFNESEGFKDDIALELYTPPQINPVGFIDAIKEREEEKTELPSRGAYTDLTCCDYPTALNPRPHLVEDDRPLIPYEIFKKLMSYRDNGDFKLIVGGKEITLPLASESGGEKVKTALGDTELNPFSIIAQPGAFMMGDSVQERARASKSLHHPSPEEIAGSASKEYEARKAALKELLESGGEIKPIPKTVYYTKEFSDALEDSRAEQSEVSDSQSSKIPTEGAVTVIDLRDGFSRTEKAIGGRTLVSYDEKPHFPFPKKVKPKKPNRNLNVIMTLLARAKK